jgi:hypothetical protein
MQRAEQLLVRAEVLDAHPRQPKQFTIASSMTATRGWQGYDSEPAVRDEVLTLGSDGQLVGIVSHPATSDSLARGPTMPLGTSAPGFLLLNAGVLHRVGPHRLHVVLARHLAGGGTTCLRLDLGGIGDSVASSGAASFRESAVADTRLAMTGLSELRGIPRFVLFGICAGADNALATALADPRVTGIILVDPPTYATRRSQLRHLRAGVAKRGRQELLRWGVSLVERQLRQTAARLARLAGRATDEPASGGRETPPIATHRAQLTALVDRGVRILAIFSGIHELRYNHADQLFEVFPELRGRLDHAYFPRANHTFTELAAQAELIDTVARWMARHHG